MSDLKFRLQREGYQVLAPNVFPSDGSQKLESLAALLKTKIDEAYGPTQKIHLIGHSMGGLVSRSYIQDLGGEARTLSLQTIATPHYGAPISALHPGSGAAQMRPDSDFLTALNAAPPYKIPEISYYTKADFVVPYKNSLRPGATNIAIPSAAHSLIPRDPDLINQVVLQLRKFETQ